MYNLYAGPLWTNLFYPSKFGFIFYVWIWDWFRLHNAGFALVCMFGHCNTEFWTLNTDFHFCKYVFTLLSLNLHQSQLSQRRNLNAKTKVSHKHRQTICFALVVRFWFWSLALIMLGAEAQNRNVTQLCLLMPQR